LVSLTLSHCQIGDVVVGAVAEALRKKNARARQLSSSALAVGRRPPSGLAALDVSFNNVKAKGCRAVGSWLARDPSLVSLVLSNNPLGDKGGRLVLEALAIPEALALDSDEESDAPQNQTPADPPPDGSAAAIAEAFLSGGILHAHR